MDSINKRKSKIKKRSKSKERLTIMVFKRVGDIRTFKVSSHFAIFASLFLLFYIVGTIFLTNAYFDVNRIHKIQSNKIAELSNELLKKTRSLEKSKQHIALLNDYIKDEKDQSPEVMTSADYTEASLPQIVDIEDLKVKRDSSNISLNFKIVNKLLNEEPIGGYMFIIADIKGMEKSETWSHPSSPLKDGMPTDYRKGQRFFIQRYKFISSTYTLSKSIDKPLILEILIYDRNGKLILKKVVEV
ncbi:MAG TPA: hypothetical protein VMW42_08970 [Desulfatiglandales bacterium]|nr:hypothetical protein [Desulfatiglandales bacterium]